MTTLIQKKTPALKIKMGIKNLIKIKDNKRNQKNPLKSIQKLKINKIKQSKNHD